MNEAGKGPAHEQIDFFRDIALLTGLIRCGRRGRTVRVNYGTMNGNAHRYQCRGNEEGINVGVCVGIGGVRVDKAVALACLEVVSGRAVEAAILA